MGDPAGIGPEITLKALADDSIRSLCRPVVIGDLATLNRTAEQLKVNVQLAAISDSFWPEESDAGGGDAIPVVDLANVPRDLPAGRASEAGGRASVDYVEKAVQLALDGNIGAIVTAPINKYAMSLAGVPYPGHTEMLAELMGVQSYSMMLVGKTFRVAHVTTHVSLREACDLVTRERVLTVIRLADDALRREGLTNPRLAVAGLNPHAGEEGLFGREEIEHIRPAVEEARRLGINVTGPWPADTLFWQAHHGRYDAVIAMYHDQGHVPIKLLGIEHGVNVTIGLPIIRTSVDHGTAYDIAGKGIADASSMAEAIRIAVRFAAKR